MRFMICHPQLSRATWAIVALSILLAGCTGSKHAREISEAAKAMVWPPPPEEARIGYVQAIARPDDAGIKRSSFSRFAHWLTGSSKGNEGLIKPFGIAVDEKDNLCLTDTGANTVCYFDRANKKWHRWDRIGKLRFISPVGIAKLNDVFYVADSGRGSVVAFADGGKFLFEITNKLERPSGIVIVAGQLFVTDSRRHCVARYDLLGHYLSEFGRRGLNPGEFNFPTHITADAQNNLYVTDSMNNRVQIFDRDGNCKGRIGSIGDSTGHFSRPKGVGVDSFGHVYVIDAMFDNLQIFDSAGKYLLTVGDAGSDYGQFWLPNGVAVSRQNEIFVTDCYNHRVQVFKYLGNAP